eukprot:gnl/Chilomastix_cuspidata/3947.p1 GENE.gnl/Chilomastix_cuspidata/3947~~gnl/Chilomastix_cuspidata/3947.p1  ORF type:complete len:400 (-),score=86.71 gnl/Chilomastix_cuspidata/3947:192-1307(-)
MSCPEDSLPIDPHPCEHIVDKGSKAMLISVLVLLGLVLSSLGASVFLVVDGIVNQVIQGTITSEEYLNTPKSLFVWAPSTQKKIGGTPSWRLLLQNADGSADYLLAFCQTHNISEAKLYIGCVEWERSAYFARGVLPDAEGLHAVADMFAAAGVEVSFLTYINDDPNDLTGYEGIQDIVNAIHAFNRGRDSPVTALHIDQEPWANFAYEDMISMLRVATAAAHAGATPLRVDISVKPQWLVETWKHEGLEDHVCAHFCRAADGAAMMAYSSSVAKIRQYASSFVAFAAAAECRAEVSVETGTKGASSSSTLASFLGDADAWFATAGALFASITAENAEVERIVIHDYSQYHYGLYGTDAYYADSATLTRFF